MASRINVRNVSFVRRSKGVYTPETTVFGSPANELRLRPNTNKKQPSITVTRYVQMEATSLPNSLAQARTSPVSVSVSVNVGLDSTVTPAQIADLVSQATSVMSPSLINQLMLGADEIDSSSSAQSAP